MLRPYPKPPQSPASTLPARATRRRSRWAALLVFALAGFAPAQAQGALSREQAQALLTPFYEAVVSTDPEEIRRVLTRLTAPGWQNCSDLEVCETRAETIRRWSARASSLSDARREQREVLIAGNRVIVRGELSGTPTAPFLGVAPNGRSFTINTVDVHEVQGGRIVRTYHLENFALALEQLAGDR